MALSVQLNLCVVIVIGLSLIFCVSVMQMTLRVVGELYANILLLGNEYRLIDP